LEAEAEQPDDGLAELAPLLRRVVAGRARDHQVVDDVVQETLTRVMAARERLTPDALTPYAIVTARNLVLSLGRGEGRARRNAHKLIDLDHPDRPDEALLRREERAAVAAAMDRLSERERALLVAHEVDGVDTITLAGREGSTPGAVAALLKRARSRLRVEYLLTLQPEEPPTARCRPVLLTLSGGDRRRRLAADVDGHLLACGFCAAIAESLPEQLDAALGADEERIPIRADTDVVGARRTGRELAARAGFGPTDLTLIATAISEIARNIVMFAGSGEIRVRLAAEPGRRGVVVTARDAGPGIADLDRALRDGYSTYGGMGLGLPGCRRLMDEFEITSEQGKGTTVVMAKWRTTQPGGDA
jgi:serine/threonine-protein kinase RsbT